VGALVRRLLHEGRDFDSLTLDDWRGASELFDRDIVGRVTPRVSASAKRTPQSTAPAAVEAHLAEIRQWLAGLAGVSG
jgi:argininosuccinate lyase